MKAGKVTVGFSKPYVARYVANGGDISFVDAQILARGVGVSIQPNTGSDNVFRADNQDAESEAGIFTGATLTLTVDGLFMAAEKFIMGIPATATSEDGWTEYNDDQEAPYCAVGFIQKAMSGGRDLYTPIIVIKNKFNQIPISANTQGTTIDWQTTELTAATTRADDAKHSWRMIGANYTTEEEAERALQEKLGIKVAGPTVAGESGNVSMFGTPVSEMQNNVEVDDTEITGTLKKLTEGSLVDRWGEGYFLALKFSSIDPRATSIKVGLDPSESSGLVEIIDDPDKNGAFKITDKDAQVFKVVTSNGNYVTTKTYSLAGLTMEG